MGSLYFAYGSNMDGEHMRAHCPASRCLGVARLDGHRLAFSRRSLVSGTGVADVVPASAEAVWGIAYELGEGDLGALDRKEGRGWAYSRELQRIALRAGAGTGIAIVYTVLRKEPVEVPPSREYLTRLISSAESHDLPEDHIARLRAVAFVP
jgi:gamma-glutamylcyclotransferase